MKYCSKCKSNKPLAQFSKSKIRKDGLSLICKDCSKVNHKAWYEKNRKDVIAKASEWRRQNRDRHRAWQKAYESKNSDAIVGYRIERAYKITLATYTAMLESQGGRCACCRSASPGTRTKRFCVDHDHVTGRVRGLLCHRCNLGIGLLGDDIGTLLDAVNYLYRSDSAADAENR